jgi:hypothetical protein
MRAGYYKYIAVRWQSLLIASRKPQETITALETTHKFRLKDQDQPPSVYALATTRGHLCYAPIKYSTSREDDWGDFKRIFGHTPQAIFTLANGDRLDTSTYWTWGGIQNISVTDWSLQSWVIQIGFWCGLLSWQCLDFVPPPRQNMDPLAKRIHGYIPRWNTVYRIPTEEPVHQHSGNCRWLGTLMLQRSQRGVESTAPRPLERVLFTTYVVLTCSVLFYAESQLLVPYIGPTKRS